LGSRSANQVVYNLAFATVLLALYQ